MHHVIAPFTARALRAVLYAVVSFPLALLGCVGTLLGLLVGGLLSITTLGLWLIALTERGALSFGALQRFLARVLLGVRLDEPVRRSEPGAFGWRRAILADRTGWRAVAGVLLGPLTALPALLTVLGCYVYGLLFLLHPVLKYVNYGTERRPDGTVEHVALRWFGVNLDPWPLWLVPVVVGAALLLVAPWLLARVLWPQQFVLRKAFGSSDVDSRIRTLERTRAAAVEDAAATLRRIERDLHDGTQARLVGLGMHLTMIRELVTAGADRDEVLTVVDTARGNATQAVADLRDLVRGIHPPVLDQGLDVALASLAADAALPVEVTTSLATRPAPALESIAYFCAAELLANVVKHAHATRVGIDVSTDAGVLRLTVHDDGRGGAVLGAGSGLTGLAARASTVDGTLTCESPAGGPTVVVVVLPLG
ncbi:MAG TPA: sensor domain-containing protein [Asanoa sp.]|nr:sensor domain-containing protein [Asanoa sp.]